MPIKTEGYFTAAGLSPSDFFSTIWISLIYGYDWRNAASFALDENQSERSKEDEDRFVI